MHHVAVGDDVFLALEPQLADVARAGLAAALDVVVERDGLGADEAALEVRMDHAGGLGGARAFRHGPGARLLLTQPEIDLAPHPISRNLSLYEKLGTIQP